MATEFRRMMQLRGNSWDWDANDIVLLVGELAIENSDPATPRMKIGDGVTNFSMLPWFGETDLTARADLSNLSLTVSDLQAQVDSMSTDTSAIPGLQSDVSSLFISVAGKQDTLPTPPAAGNMLFFDGAAWQGTVVADPVPAGTMYFWDATGVTFQAIPPGSTGQALVWEATGFPAWRTNPAAGVPEAPLDARTYARQSSAWVAIPALLSARIVNTSGATRTLVATDAGARVRHSHTVDAVFTVPLNSAVPFTIGEVVEIEQVGVGKIEVAGDVGVTVNNRAAMLPNTAEQFGVVRLMKVGTDEWTLSGDLEPV